MKRTILAGLLLGGSISAATHAAPDVHVPIVVVAATVAPQPPNDDIVIDAPPIRSHEGECGIVETSAGCGTIWLWDPPWCVCFWDRWLPAPCKPELGDCSVD